MKKPSISVEDPPVENIEKTTIHEEEEEEESSDIEAPLKSPKSALKTKHDDLIVTSKVIEKTPSSSASLAAKRESTTKHHRPADIKRAKKGKQIHESEDKKIFIPFQRIWSEHDEIALLKGINEFTANNLIDLSKNMKAFYDFIKKKKSLLHVDFTATQLKDKICKMRNNFRKINEKGTDATFLKIHDLKVFVLSQKIWGSAGAGAGSSSTRQLRIQNDSLLGKQWYGGDVVKLLGTKDFFEIDMLEGAKKAELEEKWRELEANELELRSKKDALIIEHLELLMDV